MTAPRARALVEIVRARRGRLELVGEHARRLARSAARVGFGEPLDGDAIERAIDSEWRRRGAGEGLLRLRLDARGLAVEAAVAPPFDAETLAAGIGLVLVPEPAVRGAPPQEPGDLKWDDPERAAHSRERAAARGAGDGLRVDRDDRVLGTSSTNLFVVTGGGLVTPPAAEGAFPGIARAAVLRASRDLGIPAREATVRRDDVEAAHDAFLVASACGILSVRSIEGRRLEPPPAGTDARGLVPRLRLRVHELCRERRLPD